MLMFSLVFGSMFSFFYFDATFSFLMAFLCIFIGFIALPFWTLCSSMIFASDLRKMACTEAALPFLEDRLAGSEPLAESALPGSGGGTSAGAHGTGEGGGSSSLEGGLG